MSLGDRVNLGFDIRLDLRTVPSFTIFAISLLCENPIAGSMPRPAETACVNPSTVWWRATNTSRSKMSWILHAYMTSS